MVLYTYRATLGSLHGTEADENGGGPGRVSQDTSFRPLFCAVIKDAKVAMGARATCMHHTFWNALVVEAGDLFPSDLILE